MCFFFFFQAEDGIRDVAVTGVQTCALPISLAESPVCNETFAALSALASSACSLASSFWAHAGCPLNSHPAVIASAMLRFMTMSSFIWVWCPSPDLLLRRAHGTRCHIDGKEFARTR